ncbi:MAG TPA: hypothetical protein VMM35_09385 [Longimicrobiales bacterium]|nr:hypothetical protein [Longimicrobiales bacterium]
MPLVIEVKRRLRVALAVLGCLAGAWVPASAQVGAVAGTDTAAIVVDPGDVRGSARSAQARFERLRERHLPLTFSSGGGDCDEVVGRFCTWYGEGEWRPAPDPEEVQRLRAELLAELDSLQRLSPGDDWIVGQRVWYRAEGGDWEGALVTARGCAAEAWWCEALEGLALHGLGRFVEAEVAFARALRDMDEERAREWRLLERVVDGDTRDWLRDLEHAGPDSLQAGLEWLWRLADPLYVVQGNDRLTAHYARWTVATLKDEARNPHRTRWGDDMEELTVRHGWELGWERSPSRTLGSSFTIMGHKHPEAREWMPAEAALAAPTTVAAGQLLADRRRPRSLYAPAYAPIILPMDAELTVFPRMDRTLVVATAFLPKDTTYHADHDHERPWLEPGEQAGMPDRIGLFALPVDGGQTIERHDEGSTDGTLLLDLPVGGYIVSVESWSPEQRRAGRLRLGLEARLVLPDIAALSDLLLLEGDRPAPTSLQEALPAALPRARIRPGQRIAIAWEVAGLGFRPETLELEVSVDRTDRNILRRLGEFLGLTERPPSLALSWEEPAPTQPTHHFRHLALDLPELDPGTYQITLTLRTQGRADAITRKTFEVVEP